MRPIASRLAKLTRSAWHCARCAPAAGALLGLVLGMTGTPAANAADLGPRQTKICFDTQLARGRFFHVDDAGRIGHMLPSRNATLLDDSDDDLLTAAYLRPSLTLFYETGVEIGANANLQLTSNEIVSASPAANDVAAATTANVPVRQSRYYAKGEVCTGFGTLRHHGTRYKWHANGVAGVDGDGGSSDQTIVRVRIFRLEPGTLDALRTHVIERQGSTMALLSDIVLVDFDHDGDDELVVFRAQRIDQVGDRTRFRISVDSFDALTAELENSFKTIVSDQFIDHNASP